MKGSLHKYQNFGRHIHLYQCKPYSPCLDLDLKTVSNLDSDRVLFLSIALSIFWLQNAFLHILHNYHTHNIPPGRLRLMSLNQWFLTGGTRTSWGYQTPQQGVRSTSIFRHTCPENFKDVLSIVVSAVNFVRSQTLITACSEFFVTKFKLNTMFFFTTRNCRCYPVFECLYVFVSCARKSSSFWDTEVVA